MDSAYSLEGQIERTDGTESTAIDLTDWTVTATPLSAIWLALFNTPPGICEKTDWAVGETVDVTGNTACGEDLDVPANGDTRKEVLQLLDENTMNAGVGGETNGPREEKLVLDEIPEADPLTKMP